MTQFSPVDIISSWFSMLVYHLGDENRPFGCCSSEMQSHPIGMIIVMVQDTFQEVHAAQLVKKCFLLSHNIHCCFLKSLLLNVALCQFSPMHNLLPVPLRSILILTCLLCLGLASELLRFSD
jgi:hypothetical protein